MSAEYSTGGRDRCWEYDMELNTVFTYRLERETNVDIVKCPHCGYNAARIRERVREIKKVNIKAIIIISCIAVLLPVAIYIIEKR